MQVDSSHSAPSLQTLTREAFWQRHVAQWRTSGLSKMAYCEQYSLVYHQMVYWSRKEEPLSDESAVSSGGFVPVVVPPTTASDFGLVVRLPNGMTIEGIGDRSVELVSKLVAQL